MADCEHRKFKLLYWDEVEITIECPDCGTRWGGDVYSITNVLEKYPVFPEPKGE